MIIPSPSQAHTPFARSLLCLTFVLILTGTIVDVAAAPYKLRPRMVELQNRAEGAHFRPSRTLKQFDPHKLKPQRVRRANHSRPSHRPGQDGNDDDGNHDNTGHSGGDGNNGNSGDAGDGDNDNGDDENEDTSNQNDDGDDEDDGSDQKIGRDS